MNRSKLIEKRDLSDRLQQSKSHEMRVQVSLGVHPEVSSQSALRMARPVQIVANNCPSVSLDD